MISQLIGLSHWGKVLHVFRGAVGLFHSSSQQGELVEEQEQLGCGILAGRKRKKSDCEVRLSGGGAE